MKTVCGGNVQKLIARKALNDLIPEDGDIAAAISNFSNERRRVKAFEEATAYIEAAIQAVKDADDNPWGDDDEEIAGAILRKIEEVEQG